MSTSLECCLCGQIKGEHASDLIARMLPDEPYTRRIMLESPNFAAIPDLGPLAPGHSLLCPKAHVRSLAEIDSNLHAEYEVLKARLRALLSDAYSTDVCWFEHGAAPKRSRVVCTVDHAHLHVVPLPRGLPFPAAAGRAWTEFDGSLATLRRLAAGDEYVIYETPDGVCRLATAGEQPFESQYMRKLLAECLGRAAWNWRAAPDPRAADEVWRRLAHA